MYKVGTTCHDHWGDKRMEILCEGWAVVMSKPMAEFLAQDALRRRGRRVVLPVYRKVLRGKRKSRGAMVFRPLFQSYLFVELHPGQAWIDILHTPGVYDLVRRAGERDLPAMLAPDLVAAIRAESEAGIFDDPRPGAIKLPLAKPGDKMRVADGPFASFLAELQEVDDRGRARTLLGLFKRQVPAAFHLASLDAVSA